MPATPERAAFSAEEYRIRTWESQGVRDLYGRVARNTEDVPIESFFADPNHAQVMLNERGLLIGGHARRFRTTVDQLLLASDLDVSQIAPSVTLIDEELVVEDLVVAVVGIDSVDFETGRTTLSLWGNVGPVPVSIQSAVMSAAGVASMEVVHGSTQAGAMVSAGVGGFAGIGQATKEAVLSSASVAAMAAGGAGIAPAVLAAAGASTVSIEGDVAPDGAGDLAAAGAAAVSFSGLGIAASVMSAAGVASFSALNTPENALQLNAETLQLNGEDLTLGA